MTVKQMLDSLPVLQRVMELKLPIKKAHKLYSLAKSINEQREFFINEEKKLVKKFNGEIVEGFNLKFENSEDQAKFAVEHIELLSYEIPELAAIELSFDDLGDVAFTPIELSMLEGVIIFN